MLHKKETSFSWKDSDKKAVQKIKNLIIADKGENGEKNRDFISQHSDKDLLSVYHMWQHYYKLGNGDTAKWDEHVKELLEKKDISNSLSDVKEYELLPEERKNRADYFRKAWDTMYLKYKKRSNPEPKKKEGFFLTPKQAESVAEFLIDLMNLERTYDIIDNDKPNQNLKCALPLTGSYDKKKKVILDEDRELVKTMLAEVYLPEIVGKNDSYILDGRFCSSLSITTNYHAPSLLYKTLSFVMSDDFCSDTDLLPRSCIEVDETGLIFNYNYRKEEKYFFNEAGNLIPEKEWRQKDENLASSSKNDQDEANDILKSYLHKIRKKKGLEQ